MKHSKSRSSIPFARLCAHQYSGSHKQTKRLMTALSCFVTLLVAVGIGGCDSKSEHKNTSANAVSSPGAEIPPPRPIPAESLPFATDELNVTAAFPAPGEQRVALVSSISVTFDASLLQGQDLAQAIRVRSTAGEALGNISQHDDQTLVFHPDALWTPSTRYAIEINPSLMSSDGLLVNEELRWEFLTIADVYTTSQSVIDLCMSELDVEMLAGVNHIRSIARSCGDTAYPATGKLSWNCRLQSAAIAHSQDMATNDFFDHTGSDGSKIEHRIVRAGYSARFAGENLAAGHDTVPAALTGLLGSVEHCAILMASEFTEFGLGYAFQEGTEYHHYWTQNFGRPLGK